MKFTDIVSILAGFLIGLFGVVITIGALLGKSDGDSWLGHVALTIAFGLVPMAIAGLLFFRVWRGVDRRRREALERRILALCADHGGRLTPSIVAGSTDLTLAESKEILDRLHLDGHCGVDLGDDGDLSYAFRGFAS